MEKHVTDPEVFKMRLFMLCLELLQEKWNMLNEMLGGDGVSILQEAVNKLFSGGTMQEALDIALKGNLPKIETKPYVAPINIVPIDQDITEVPLKTFLSDIEGDKISVWRVDSSHVGISMENKESSVVRTIVFLNKENLRSLQQHLNAILESLD